MTLESTILCVDNSDYMRNGDYMPTRGLAQQDAVNMICHAKTRSNPENNIGLITMADKQVLVTLTTDAGKIMNKMHLLQLKGGIDFITSIKIAHLALKHRQGRNHKMRIIVFVGSPVEVDEKELLKIAKKLKKEKVNVDIINFGETDVNSEKLTNFISTLNGKEGTGSHLVTIPPGPVLSEALMSSPIMSSGDNEGGSASGTSGAGLVGGPGGMNDFEFGIDPSTDPELILALRVSMEEQRARQEAEARAQAQANAAPTTEAVASDPIVRVASQAPNLDLDGTAIPTEHLTEEEILLNQALAMSMGLDPSALAGTGINLGTLISANASGNQGVLIKPDHPQMASTQDHPMTEEEEIAMALQMSLQSPGEKKDDENMELEHHESKDEKDKQDK